MFFQRQPVSNLAKRLGYRNSQSMGTEVCSLSMFPGLLLVAFGIQQAVRLVAFGIYHDL